MNYSLSFAWGQATSFFSLLEDKQTSSLGVFDECKTHLCFEFISHAILCILYPYSCKTHKISSKLGFVEFFDEKQVIWQEMSNIISKEESTKSL